MKIAVAGTGYVGLSIATLLAQHNEVVAVDVIPEKVDLINNKKSPIQDDYIEDLKSIATYQGYSPEDIDRFLKSGFSPDEIEEFIYCGYGEV